MVITVGAGVYDFQVIWAGVPPALLALEVAMFCFCSLGLAVSVLVPSAESAIPIAWGTILPLCFISDVFQPIDNAPPWLRAIASAFPLRPFADDLESAFNPVTGTRSIHPEHLELIALWGVAAAALLAFRWQPDGRHRRERESRPRRPAAFAADRVRELREPRGRREPRARLGEQFPRAVPRTPGRAGGGAVEAQTERIEGPAPAEDSSVPPETAGVPPTSPAPEPTAAMQSLGRIRSNHHSVSGRGADGGGRRDDDHEAVRSSSRSSEAKRGSTGR